MRDSQSFQNNPSNPFCSTPAESSRSITRSIIADATGTALILSRACLGVSADAKSALLHGERLFSIESGSVPRRHDPTAPGSIERPPF